MADEVKEKAAAEAPKNPVLFKYTVVHYENGAVDVVPLEADGHAPITKDEAFNDIVQTAKMVTEQQEYLRVRKAAADGVIDALAAANKAAAEASKKATVDSEVKK